MIKSHLGQRKEAYYPSMKKRKDHLADEGLWYIVQCRWTTSVLEIEEAVIILQFVPLSEECFLKEGF